jgi:hypothetical protein
MAVEKQRFHEDHNEQFEQNSRITLDTKPELRDIIRYAAYTNKLTVKEYLERFLEQSLSEEIGRTLHSPLTLKAIERLHQLRQQLQQDNQGRLFDSAEVLRQIREERSQ